MLQISKFKLIDQGRGGIEIEGRESMVMQGGYAVIDKIKRERRLMLAPDVIAKIQELKYFFFNLTAHWLPPFNKYYDVQNHRLAEIELDENGKMKQGQSMLRNLWSITDITGISYKNGGFVITGKINSIEGKCVVINTPFITEGDDVGFFSDVIDKIDECIKLIIEYLDRKELPAYDPKAVLSADELKDEDISNLSKKVVDKLIDKGLIVLVNDNEDNYPKLPFNGTTVHESGSIDGENIPHAEEVDGDIELTPEMIAEAEAKDKAMRDQINAKAEPFGKGEAVTDEFPVADGEYRGASQESPADLEMHEYSDQVSDEQPEDMKFD